MVRIDLFQSNISLAMVHRCDETPAFTFLSKFLSTLLEVGIKLRKTLPKVFYRTLEIIIRDEEVLLNILLFYLVASLTCKDN